jgi:hypothetical protein
MSRGKGQTVTIRIYASDRDVYNTWCQQKQCDMPDLHRMMIKYGIRKQQQSFYSSLPQPSKFAKQCIRRTKSIIKKNYIQFNGSYNG